MTSLNDLLAGTKFDDPAVGDGDLPVEVAVVVRMVDSESGDSYVFYTSSEGANTYSLRGILDEALAIEKAVSSFGLVEGDDE